MSNKKQYTKSVTPIDDYVCTLPEATKKVAEDELRETDSVRRHALESLREWAEKNPRIKAIRLDSTFLLKFLRCKKFSLPMAKEQIERYLVLRHYVYEDRKVFTNFDYKLPVMQELIDLGYIFPLPQRDHLNRRVVMYRPGVFNPSKHHNYEMVKLHGLTYETLMEDELVQVHGMVHIIDSSGLGLHYLTIFTPHEAYRIGRNLEKIVPIRQKEIHGLKVHPSLKFAVDFALSQMNDKMRKRVFLYKNIEDINVDKSLLPLEYGGIIPMKNMIESFKQELATRHETLISINDKMDVNIEMYPEQVRNGSVRSLKMTIDEIESEKSYNKNNYSEFGIQSVQGSFRKLEID